MRIVNRIAMVLLGLASLALGAWALAEVVAESIGRAPVLADPTDVVDALGGRNWDDTVVVQVVTIILLVGLVLVVAQLVPRRPDDYPVADGADPTRRGGHLAWDRHGLARLARQVAASRPDVAEVTGVRLVRRGLHVNARTYTRSDPSVVERDLEASLRAGLDELGLQATPSVHAHVTAGDRRTR